MTENEGHSKPKYPYIRVQLDSDFANYPDIVPRVVFMWDGQAPEEGGV